MAGLDKYLKKNSSKSLSVVKSSSEGRQKARERLLAKGEAEVERAKVNQSKNFAICLDATGSMHSLINSARKSIKEILKRVYKEAQVEIGIRIFIFRDYDVRNDVLETSSLSENSRDLEVFLDKVKTFGGGANGGEAIEQALQAALNEGDYAAILVAGDEPANPRDEIAAAGLHQQPSALDLADRAGREEVPVHTFLVGCDGRAKASFEDIARRSGGVAGQLDGSQEMIDMAVMAFLERLKGRASVQTYLEQHALSSSAKAFGEQLLLSGPRS